MSVPLSKAAIDFESGGQIVKVPKLLKTQTVSNKEGYAPQKLENAFKVKSEMTDSQKWRDCAPSPSPTPPTEMWGGG